MIQPDWYLDMFSFRSLIIALLTTRSLAIIGKRLWPPVGRDTAAGIAKPEATTDVGRKPAVEGGVTNDSDGLVSHPQVTPANCTWPLKSDDDSNKPSCYTPSAHLSAALPRYAPLSAMTSHDNTTHSFSLLQILGCLSFLVWHQL